ncbi:MULTISPECIES: murein L,D-transpeptidase family protein [unclassified Herbaspirillum]|uniref:L,D-transpeptidase family protein n=1 Tax=unclassified Herbaspirillum TaxID=2624150 RepID=UPI001154C1C8|nr:MULTISPECIES: L,D-transpeptidase family protein [unclassified Herbaspirillum]TQK04039.1 murein L,D-transpeptidase YafK [Herbaspirillum sp. SJZ106]TQK14629.1 murein L,D-transpeptidase YafK [Herbaspirillum sp. SJZ130]
MLGRLLMLFLAGLPTTGSVASSSSIPPQSASPAAPGKPDPEALLIDVYKDLGANRLREALDKANALVAAYPTFRLGHLVQGDLLLMHARPVRNFGAMADAPQDKLKELRDEAMVRIRSLQEKPDPNLIPKAVLQMGEDQKNVLVVDTSRSRLYVYENQDGQLKYQSDYYISQGRFGANKTKEGDQRTPIGVYYVNNRIPGPKLPDFYGTGALPLSYPNEWDKRNGRSGYGIWLHGTPSDNFSRPPLSSDGCVVLANPDLQSLYSTAEVGKTVVVISQGVQFVNKGEWDRQRQAATAMLEQWQQSLESADSEKTLSYYSRDFRSALGESLPTWFSRQQKSMNGARFTSVKLRDVSLFRYPGPEDMIVSTFIQESAVGKSKNAIRKRQYWVKEGSEWKIIYEGNA